MKTLPILIETDDFLLVNKPSGLLSIPDRFNESIDSVVKILRRTHPEIFVVHRLDRLTSGILIFAKTPEAHKHFSDLFKNRKIEKIYTGIVSGKMETGSGIIEAPIAENPYRKGEMVVHKKGKPSATEYQVVESFTRFSLVKFKLLTGRTHQIRVHSKYINHPLACDPVYGDGKPIYLSDIKKGYRLGKNQLDETPLMNRLALHASSLSFVGSEGKNYSVEAPLPKDLNAVIQQLRKNPA